MTLFFLFIACLPCVEQQLHESRDIFVLFTAVSLVPETLPAEE